MKPERITAAHLVTLRSGPDAAREIGNLLGVAEMPPMLARRTRAGIADFIATGDATAASQLIHAALVRQTRSPSAPGAGGGGGMRSHRR